MVADLNDTLIFTRSNARKKNLYDEYVSRSPEARLHSRGGGALEWLTCDDLYGALEFDKAFQASVPREMVTFLCTLTRERGLCA